MGRMGIKDKVYDLWSFYKWFIIAAFIVFFLLVYFLYSHFSQKETYLSVMLMDCHSAVAEEQMVSDYEAFDADFDKSKYEVTIQTSLMIDSTQSENYAFTSLARFLADVGSEKLDVCGMVEEDFEKYASSDTWMDLGLIFSQDELDDLAQYLYRDSDGRVVGIYVKGLPLLKEYECYESQEGIIGIVYNTQRVHAAASYIQYLLGTLK